MKKQTLAGTDLEVGRICLGTGGFGEKTDDKQARLLLDCFVDGGGCFIDTANVYCRWVPGRGNSSEQYIGRWLRDRKASGKVVVATKGGHYDLSRPQISRVTEADVRKDLEDSLRTLGLERIDLYWLHRDNPDLPVSEIIGFMEELKQEGKIRFYGASNFPRERMDEAVRYARENGIQGFSAVSNQWSIASVNPGKNLNQDRTLVMTDAAYQRWHEKTGIPLIPFSSGAQGFFSRLERAGVQAKGGAVVREGELSLIPQSVRDAYLNRRNLAIDERFLEIKKETGISMHSLTLLSLLGRSFQVIPVAAASRPDQVEEILEAGETDIMQDLAKEIQRFEEEEA